MPREIALDISFVFYPDSDDQELFGEAKSADEEVAMALDLATYDLIALAKANHLQDYLRAVTIGESDRFPPPPEL